MTSEILYDIDPRPLVSLNKLLRQEIRRYGVRTANQSTRANRHSPFMEK